jgi:mono/diheme cytochrome c family protein
MLSTVSLVVAALSTGNEIALAVVGGAFILFALVSSFVLPARYPDFPGRHVGWYVAAGILFFVAMISAVLVFGVEKKEAAKPGEATTAAATTAATATTAVTTTTASTTSTSSTTSTATAVQGDPVAGKSVFTSAGCSGCHTLKAAGASGTVGPNLDQVKPSYDKVVHQVEVGGGAMPPFKGTLTPKQIQDVAAFVFTSTHA